MDTVAHFEYADTVARKGYQCSECYRDIRSGEPFRRRRIQWSDGNWKNYPMCNDCLGIEHDMFLEPTDYLPGGLFARARAEAKADEDLQEWVDDCVKPRTGPHSTVEQLTLDFWEVL